MPSSACSVDTRDDVDRLCELVSAAGHPVAQEPYDAFFGSRYAIVIDPDGNQVGLKSPIEDDRATFPNDCYRLPVQQSLCGQAIVVVCGNGGRARPTIATVLREHCPDGP